MSKLKEVGIPVLSHRARQMTKADYGEYDYLIGMDSANIRNMNRILGGIRKRKCRNYLILQNEKGILRIRGTPEILI